MPRSAQRKKDDRFSLRITDEQKSTIEYAAELRRTSASNFMLETAYTEAVRVIEEANQVHLQAEIWERFYAELEAPPKEIPALKRFLAQPTVFD
jgi:uncharacterized protein (DUF1778 family)